MNDVEMEHRMTCVEKLAASNRHRIDDLEKSTDALNSLATSMAVMAQKQEAISASVDSINGNVDAIGKRVGDLEAKPGKRWDALLDKLIYAVVGAFIAWIISGAPGLN